MNQKSILLTFLLLTLGFRASNAAEYIFCTPAERAIVDALLCNKLIDIKVIAHYFPEVDALGFERAQERVGRNVGRYVGTTLTEELRLEKIVAILATKANRIAPLSDKQAEALLDYYYYEYRRREGGRREGAPILQREDLFSRKEIFELFANSAFEDRSNLVRSTDPALSESNEVFTFDSTNLPKYQSESAKIPWAQYRGKTVTVEYAPYGIKLLATKENTVSQKVMSLDGLDVITREVGLSLLKNTHKLEREARKFQETGVWIVRFDGLSYQSKFFHSASGVEISGKIAFGAFNELIDILKVKEPKDYFTEIVFMHTHPGKGGPLSVLDQAAMRALRKELKIGGPQRIRAYALPVDDNGQIIFEQTLSSE